jgi:hypothetical protein
MKDIYGLYFLMSPDLEKAFGCYESSGGDYIFWAGAKQRSKGCHFGPCGGAVSKRAESKVQAGWRQIVPVVTMHDIGNANAVILHVLSGLRSYQPLFVETADQLVRQKLAERGIPTYGNFMPKELAQRKGDVVPEQAMPIVLPEIHPVQPWAF